MASFRSRYRAATDGEFRLKDHRTDDDSCFDGDKDDGRISMPFGTKTAIQSSTSTPSARKPFAT